MSDVGECRICGMLIAEHALVTNSSWSMVPGGKTCPDCAKKHDPEYNE